MILITGATGNNGSEIVKQLAETGQPMRALVRDPQKDAEKVDAMRSRGVEIATGDLADPASLSSALEGVDRALLLSGAGPEQVELQGNFIDAAKSAGVRHVVKFSMYAAAPDSPFVLGQWHAETEEKLKGSGLDWTILQPNDLMQNMRRFASSIKERGEIVLPLGNGRVSMIDLQDVAAVAVETLTGDGHAGKTYVLTGPEALSYDDVAEKLSGALGQQVRYVDQSPDEFKQGLVDAGTPEAAADMFLTMYGMERGGSGEEVTTAVADVLGRPSKTFDEFAREWAPSVQAAPA